MIKDECFNNIDLLNDSIAIAISAINEYPCIKKALIKIKQFHRDLLDHSLNVGFLSYFLGRNRYDKDDCKKLFIAAILHDYGKCYIAKSVLYKIETLTNKERRIIEAHPLLGHYYLSLTTNLPMVILNGILEHHEKVDGTGYCQKLVGSQISDFAKIIKISDVYDAMTSDRIYRKAMERELVCEYIREQEGIHFDSNIVTEFIEASQDIDLPQLLEDFRQRFYSISSSKRRR